MLKVMSDSSGTQWDQDFPLCLSAEQNLELLDFLQI